MRKINALLKIIYTIMLFILILFIFIKFQYISKKRTNFTNEITKEFNLREYGFEKNTNK